MKFKLRKGTLISRRKVPRVTRDQGENPYWYKFVTTKDAYYTVNDLEPYDSQEYIVRLSPPKEDEGNMWDQLSIMKMDLVKIQ